MVIQDTQELAKEILKNFKETSRKEDVLHQTSPLGKNSISSEIRKPKRRNLEHGEETGQHH